MIAQLLRAAGVPARHGSTTVELEDEKTPKPGSGTGWAVPAGQIDEGKAIEISRRLGPARLLAYGELGPELSGGMSLSLRVLRRGDGAEVLKLGRRFFVEETIDLALALARSLAALEGQEAAVDRLDPAEALGSGHTAALLALHQGLDALIAGEAGLAGGDGGRAVELFLEALTHAPGFAEARDRALAALALHTGRSIGVDRGLELSERLIRALPADPEPVLVRAELLLHRGDDPGRARELLEEASEAFPDDFRLQALLGGVLVALGEHGPAEERYRRALELRPDDPALMSNLALVLASLGRPAEARPLARRAVELAPDDPVCRQVERAVVSKQ